MGQPNPTAVNLLIDGKVVATATGHNSADTELGVLGRRASTRAKQATDPGRGPERRIRRLGPPHRRRHRLLRHAAAKPSTRETGVNLLVDGQVVRTATGADSENLDWASWDLRDLIGKQAQIQIVDDNTGGWGHVLADQFMLADTPALSGTPARALGRLRRGPLRRHTYNDAPGGKRIMIAWMNNWNYGGDHSHLAVAQRRHLPPPSSP